MLQLTSCKQLCKQATMQATVTQAGNRHHLGASTTIFMVTQNESKETSMLLFMAVTKDSNYLCCFFTVDFYLFYGGRVWAAQSWLHTADTPGRQSRGLKGPGLQALGVPTQDWAPGQAQGAPAWLSPVRDAPPEIPGGVSLSGKHVTPCPTWSTIGTMDMCFTI